MGAAYVYGAVRTPFGRYCGALAKTRPDDLAAHALRALLDRVPELDPGAIDDVLLGDANAALQKGSINVTYCSALTTLALGWHAHLKYMV